MDYIAYIFYRAGGGKGEEAPADPYKAGGGAVRSHLSYLYAIIWTMFLNLIACKYSGWYRAFQPKNFATLMVGPAIVIVALTLLFQKRYSNAKFLALYKRFGDSIPLWFAKVLAFCFSICYLFTAAALAGLNIYLLGKN
jgi:hypothetical protein